MDLKLSKEIKQKRGKNTGNCILNGDYYAASNLIIKYLIRQKYESTKKALQMKKRINCNMILKNSALMFYFSLLHLLI